jgi:DNA mismatch repair protein MutS
MLNLTLTTYQRQYPMTGFSKYKLEHYVGLFLKAGHRVAVCEMVSEKPKSRRKAS